MEAIPALLVLVFGGRGETFRRLGELLADRPHRLLHAEPDSRLAPLLALAPDLIVVDLPLGSGASLVRDLQMQPRYAGTPITLLSAADPSRARTALLRLNASAHVASLPLVGLPPELRTATTREARAQPVVRDAAMQRMRDLVDHAAATVRRGQDAVRAGRTQIASSRQLIDAASRGDGTEPDEG